MQPSLLQPISSERMVGIRNKPPATAPLIIAQKNNEVTSGNTSLVQEGIKSQTNTRRFRSNSCGPILQSHEKTCNPVESNDSTEMNDAGVFRIAKKVDQTSTLYSRQLLISSDTAPLYLQRQNTSLNFRILARFPKLFNLESPGPAACLGLHALILPRENLPWKMQRQPCGSVRLTFSQPFPCVIKSLLMSSVQKRKLKTICDASTSSITNLANQKEAVAQARFLSTKTVTINMTGPMRMVLHEMQRCEHIPREALTHIRYNTPTVSPREMLVYINFKPRIKSRRGEAKRMPYSGARYIRFSHLPYYSPKLLKIRQIMGNKHFRFKWKPGPLKWPKDDRYVRTLDPREIALAAKLGISGRTYCDCKHRMFAERIFRGGHGYPLRLIDAQRACRTNSQITARLYEAFSSAGWFKLQHCLSNITKSLNRRKPPSLKPVLRANRPLGFVYCG